MPTRAGVKAVLLGLLPFENFFISVNCVVKMPNLNGNDLTLNNNKI